MSKDMTAAQIKALERADKLINWMAGYIGKMAPGDYHRCYADLNEHGLFMERLHARKLTGDGG